MIDPNDMYSLKESELEKVSGGAMKQPLIDAVFYKVQGILADRLKVSSGSVALKSSIVDDLGADSLDVVDILSCAEKRFQIKFDQAGRGGVKTVQDLCDLVKKSM